MDFTQLLINLSVIKCGHFLVHNLPQYKYLIFIIKFIWIQKL